MSTFIKTEKTCTRLKIVKGEWFMCNDGKSLEVYECFLESTAVCTYSKSKQQFVMCMWTFHHKIKS